VWRCGEIRSKTRAGVWRPHEGVAVDTPQARPGATPAGALAAVEATGPAEHGAGEEEAQAALKALLHNTSYDGVGLATALIENKLSTEIVGFLLGACPVSSRVMCLRLRLRLRHPAVLQRSGVVFAAACPWC
jgi:hypothetical protein